MSKKQNKFIKNIKSKNLWNELIKWLFENYNNFSMTKYTSMYLNEKGYTLEEINEVYEMFYNFHSFNNLIKLSDKDDEFDEITFLKKNYLVMYNEKNNIRILDNFEEKYIKTDVYSFLLKLHANNIINNVLFEILIDIIISDSIDKGKALELNEIKGIVSGLLFKIFYDADFKKEKNINNLNGKTDLNFLAYMT